MQISQERGNGFLPPAPYLLSYRGDTQARWEAWGLQSVQMQRNRRGLVLASVPCQEASGLKHITLISFLGLLFVPMYVYHPMNGPGGIN